MIGKLAWFVVGLLIGSLAQQVADHKREEGDPVVFDDAARMAQRLTEAMRRRGVITN